VNSQPPFVAPRFRRAIAASAPVHDAVAARRCGLNEPEGTHMRGIRLEHLLTVRLQVPSIADLGATPWGGRRIAHVAGGTFEGPKLKGTVRDHGGDWILVRPDGVTQLDVRLTMETDDGALIYMTYRGYRHGPKEVMDRIARGEAVDPELYYFRTAPFFETGAPKYAWLNSVVTVATGHRLAEGPVYEVHQVL